MFKTIVFMSIVLQAGDQTLDLASLWPYAVSILTLVVLPLLVSGDSPVGAVKLINWAKNALGLSGGWVYAVVLVVSVGIAGIVALVDGTLVDFVDMTPEKFSMLVAFIFGASQLWYSRIKGELDGGGGVEVLSQDNGQ